MNKAFYEYLSARDGLRTREVELPNTPEFAGWIEQNGPTITVRQLYANELISASTKGVGAGGRPDASKYGDVLLWHAGYALGLDPSQFDTLNLWPGLVSLVGPIAIELSDMADIEQAAELKKASGPAG